MQNVTQEATPGTQATQKVPMPIPPRNPIRFAVRGVTDKIADLKAYVNGLECHPGLKAFLVDELDGLKSNAAELHWHDVEKPEGGFDLHVSLAPRQLGGAKDSVFKRGGG